MNYMRLPRKGRAKEVHQLAVFAQLWHIMMCTIDKYINMPLYHREKSCIMEGRGR